MQGVVASGAVLYLQCWSNQKAGPLFVAAYTPIQPIFATIFGFYFLGEALYLGRYDVLHFFFFVINWCKLRTPKANGSKILFILNRNNLVSVLH